VVNSRLRTVKSIPGRRSVATLEIAIRAACGDLADFVLLTWEGLNLMPRRVPKEPAKELILNRGAELPKEALETYRKNVGKFICWSAFTSVTTERKVAEDFAGPRRGGEAVIFELRSTGRPRIKNVSDVPKEEELLLHPFTPLKVEAVDGNIVRLVEAEIVHSQSMLTTNYGGAVQKPIVIAAGTLLAENAQAVESLPVTLQVAELLLSKGAGKWDMGEFKAKVIGKAPLLVLVEFAGGVCGGFAAVPFQDKVGEYVADPTGASFVFSLQPTAARYSLEDKARALHIWADGFSFHECVTIWNDGEMRRMDRTYAVPSDWKTGCVNFTRFEIWRVTL
jgi:hypothetical protein